MIKVEQKDYLEPQGRVNKFNKENIVQWNNEHHDDLVNKLKAGIQVLNEAGIKNWWIDCGTLLGCYRNGKFIPHDIDIDFAYDDRKHTKPLEEAIKKNPNWECYSDYQEKDDTISQIIKTMDSFPLDNPELGQNEVSILNRAGNFSDFYTYHEENENYVHEFNYPDKTKNYTYCIPKEYIFPLKTMTLEGVEVQVPGNSEKYLESIYGYLGKDYYFCQKTMKYRKIGT